MKGRTLLVISILVLLPFLAAGGSREEIERSLPGSPRIESMRFDESIGMYEIFAHGQVFYISQNLKYLFVGNIIDLQSRKNVTAERVRELRRVDFSSLPREDAIRLSGGNRAIAVFTDVDCPYCKKLHGELKKLKDTSVYVFLYPLSEEGRKKSIEIWCSEDRLKSLDAAFEGKKVKGGSCPDHPVDRNLSLGRKFFISGTPTVITDSNEVINGYATAAVIQGVLERGVKAR